MMNLNAIQEFINYAPGNIVGSLERPEIIPTDILDKIPHRYSSDLIARYWLQVEKDGTIMRLLIDNDLAKYLGYTEEYLYYHACKNIGEPVVKSLIDVINGMSSSSIVIDDTDAMLYIITNLSMHFGAFYLCMPDTLEEIADKYDSDLLIIPSSKHELLFIKRSALNIPICNIKQMVYTINRTEVDSKDVLSDSVYIYDRKKKKIIVY